MQKLEFYSYFHKALIIAAFYVKYIYSLKSVKVAKIRDLWYNLIVNVLLKELLIYNSLTFMKGGFYMEKYEYFVSYAYEDNLDRTRFSDTIVTLDYEVISDLDITELKRRINNSGETRVQAIINFQLLRWYDA